MTKINLSGQRFGRLVVIGPGENRGQKTAWRCLCDCGREISAATSNLRSGHTSSCGCNHIKHGNATHTAGMTRLYRIWGNMKQRCQNPKAKYYENYGGRGISVCQEWADSFKAFYTWAMTHGYADDLQIDRINNDGDYTPDNCQWVTRRMNQSNTRQNIYIEMNGERHTVSEWARITGIPRGTIMWRLKAGKAPKEILEMQ